MDKFRQVSVDVSAVTQRVLKMCGNQRTKSERAAPRRPVGRNTQPGTEQSTLQVSDYGDGYDMKVGQHKRSGLPGGLRPGPNLYLKEPLMDRVRASSQLSSYATTLDQSASLRLGSTKENMSFDAQEKGKAQGTRRQSMTLKGTNVQGRMQRINKRTSALLEDSTLFNHDHWQDTAGLPDEVGRNSQVPDAESEDPGDVAVNLQYEQ